MVSKAVVVASRGPNGRAAPTAPHCPASDPDGSVALLPVANRALIAHAFDALRQAGVERVAVLADSALADRLPDAVRQAEFADISLTWMDGRPDADLRSLVSFADGEPVAIHLADSLTHSCLSPLLKAPDDKRDATLLVEPGTRAGRVVDLTRRQVGVVAGSDGTTGDSAGVWVLGSEVLQLACETESNAGMEARIMAAIARAERCGGRLTTLEVTDWWRYRSRPDVLLDANRFALEGLKGAAITATLIDSRIQGPVIIDPSARVESSILRGPSVIGAGVRLCDAYVGPYTAIGPDALVEGAEVEHSIVLPGASIRHVGGRLEASVVGPRAKIFRDFRLPRALRLNIGEGAEVSLA